MKLNDKVYDVLKRVAMIALDAVGVCYCTLSGIWGWPWGEEILQTCAALSILLGALLGASSAEYHRVTKDTAAT